MTLHGINFFSPSNSSDSIFEFSHEQDPESNSISPPLPSHYKDLHLQIAHWKDTKKPLYPLSNYLSFEHVSLTHKAFLTNLNTITIPTSLSEALSDRK